MCVFMWKELLDWLEGKSDFAKSRAMPIKHMATKPGKSLTLIDRFGVICCALVNFSVCGPTGVKNYKNYLNMAYQRVIVGKSNTLTSA